MDGTVLTFSQYYPLLLNSATVYDKRRDKSNPTGKSRRSVFNSDILPADHEDLFFDEYYGDDDYNVGTTTTQLQAYAMGQHERAKFKPGSRMPHV
jgi:hypothetical protein